MTPFNPFFLKAEGWRRLSIVLASVAVVAWVSFVAVASKGFSNFGAEHWLILIGAPAVAYLLILGALRAIFWIRHGFQSGEPDALPIAPANHTAAIDEHVTSRAAGLEPYYKTALGVKNQDYYLRYFSRRDHGGRWTSWNWPAFFVTFYWLLYRKMWGLATVYVLASLPGYILVETVRHSSLAIAWTVTGAWLLCMPLVANAMYYSHVRAEIRTAKGESNDEQAQLAALTSRGGTSVDAAVTGVVLTIGAGLLRFALETEVHRALQ